MIISKSATIWKINRLFSMSYREMIYRFISKIKVKFFLEKNTPKLIRDEKNYCLEYFINNSELPINDENINTLSDNNSFNLYGTEININTIKWNYDIIDNNYYPTEHISKIKLLDFSNKEVKNIFEIHRHSYLVELAIKYIVTKDKTILKTITDCLLSWLDDNPVGYGMGWLLPTILAKRLVSWLMIWQILDFNKCDEFSDLRCKLIKSIEAHLWIISESLSLYSSANNHLTAELVSLFAVFKSCTNILTEKGMLIFDRISNQLNKLIVEQNFSDGKNKECSFGYQYQVVDWFFLAYISDVRIKKRRLNVKFELYLKNMFQYFNNCFDNYFNFFDYGDRDNFSAFPCLYESSKDAYYQLLKSGAIIFENQNLINFKYQNKGLDLRNKLLFKEEKNKIKYAKIIDKKNCCKYYSESGHIIINFIDLDGNEIYFNFRAGKFGYLSIAAHSHSDLNSFFLSVNGKSIFIDPGTYCYRKEPKFRNYFRSTIAHNTVRINNQNHAISYGYNHWKNKNSISAEVIDFRDKNEQISFSSKCKFPDSSIHTRTVIIDKNHFKLLIIDQIDCKNKNFQADIAFHLHPSLSYLTDKKSIMLDNDLILKFDTQLEFKKIVGSNKPELLGWFSPEFSELTSTQSLISRVKGKNMGTYSINFEIIKAKHIN